MANVLRASTKGSRGHDPTIYPIEEKVGEDILQRWIMELLRPLVDRWFRTRGIKAFVGADQFVYYRPHSPIERVSPDIFVLPGVRPDARVPSWKTWEKGIVPSFALEIVSKDWEKDYAEAPARYAAAGVPELIVFDPDPSGHPEGIAWQVFRRVRNRPLTRIEASQGDRVQSKALGCFLRAVGEHESLRVRLATGPRGDDLFLTGEESERAAKEVERAAKEAERAAKEAEHAAKEVEHAAREVERAAKQEERAAKEAAIAARDAALKRVAELEAKLAARKRVRR
jgi:hypothetical protein